jgi:hypothetical protein
MVKKYIDFSLRDPPPHVLVFLLASILRSMEHQFQKFLPEESGALSACWLHRVNPESSSTHLAPPLAPVHLPPLALLHRSAIFNASSNAFLSAASVAQSPCSPVPTTGSPLHLTQRPCLARAAQFYGAPTRPRLAHVVPDHRRCC